jgi:hypothetical protein
MRRHHERPFDALVVQGNDFDVWLSNRSLKAEDGPLPVFGVLIM